MEWSFITVILGLSLLGIGGIVFVAIARPQYLIGWMARWSGERMAWKENRMSEKDIHRLYTLIVKSYPLILFILFIWAFVVGSVITVSTL